MLDTIPTSLSLPSPSLLFFLPHFVFTLPILLSLSLFLSYLVWGRRVKVPTVLLLIVALSLSASVFLTHFLSNLFRALNVRIPHFFFFEIVKINLRWGKRGAFFILPPCTFFFGLCQAILTEKNFFCESACPVLKEVSDL